jgi:hypothetical protein
MSKKIRTIHTVSEATAGALAPLDPPALPTITRSEANRKLKERAQELYHQAKAQREEGIRQFEAEFGRSDRIDAALLHDLQNLQVRFAAISARQMRYGYGTEPKVSKFTRQLGEIIGELSAHMATERAMELFAPVNERDYLGMSGSVGQKGLDESVLAGYQVVDDPRGARNVTPTVISGAQEVCLHENVEPYEDEPERGVCSDCGEDFAFRGGALATESGEAA